MKYKCSPNLVSIRHPTHALRGHMTVLQNYVYSYHTELAFYHCYSVAHTYVIVWARIARQMSWASPWNDFFLRIVSDDMNVPTLRPQPMCQRLIYAPPIWYSIRKWLEMENRRVHALIEHGWIDIRDDIVDSWGWFSSRHVWTSYDGQWYHETWDDIMICRSYYLEPRRQDKI